MKVFISADIEGITGTTDWDETEKKHAEYAEFREQMTAEVNAACQGALDAGAQEIWVKDAHDSARNLIAARLPREVKLLRGWSGHPYLMVSGLDATFDALLMIGYHARAGSNSNPLAHSMTTSAAFIKVNEVYASEFMLNAYTAAFENVPVVFVSGDAGLCAEAAGLVPALTWVAVKQGSGGATLNLHPERAVEQIRAGVRQALSADHAACRVALPAHFAVEIGFKQHTRAYAASFYPGASQKDAHTIRFETDHYFEVLRMITFVLN